MIRLWQALGSLGIGVFTIAANNILFSAFTGRPVSYAQDVEPINVAIVASPFLLITILGIRRWGPWLSAFGLTILLWGYALYRGIAYQLNPDGTGADIGLGMLLTLSPILVVGVALATDAILKAKDSPRS